jgi:hypothetical protein
MRSCLEDGVALGIKHKSPDVEVDDSSVGPADVDFDADVCLVPVTKL